MWNTWRFMRSYSADWSDIYTYTQLMHCPIAVTYWWPHNVLKLLKLTVTIFWYRYRYSGVPLTICTLIVPITPMAKWINGHHNKALASNHRTSPLSSAINKFGYMIYIISLNWLLKLSHKTISIDTMIKTPQMGSLSFISRISCIYSCIVLTGTWLYSHVMSYLIILELKKLPAKLFDNYKHSWYVI